MGGGPAVALAALCTAVAIVCKSCHTFVPMECTQHWGCFGLEGLGDVEGVLCGVIERSHDDNKQATSVFHLNMS